MTAQKLEAALRGHALSYPESYEEFPWGERAIKIRGKVFLFMSANQKKVTFSCKLPHSGFMALTLPFTEPTGYGLGKSGWVTAHLDPAAKTPLGVFEAWIDESFRAVAPKKLVALLEPGGSGGAKLAGPVRKAGSRKPKLPSSRPASKKSAKKT